jgi:hypothetical protein
VRPRSPATKVVLIAALAACGGTPRPANHAEIAATARADAAQPEVHELETLESPPRPKLLSIDWANTPLASDADARAVWTRIAPTGTDWEDKLDEIPETAAPPLAAALLREGNFTCMQPRVTNDCAKPQLDVDPPHETSTLADPCLRRLIALWALQQIDGQDLSLRDALRAIVAIPAPESQLVTAALGVVPEGDQDGKLELLGIAWHAGQHDLVNASLGTLDDTHLVAAAQKLHIDGALEGLSAERDRGVFITAIGDDQLGAAARRTAMIELAAEADGEDVPLPPDLRTALAAATRAKDCSVAAQAIRIFHDHKDDRFVPKPSAQNAMRTLCVIASIELQARNDEASLVVPMVPPRGLDLVKVTYDPYGEEDPDGDGDPHTERTVMTVPRGEAMLPDIEDLVRAFEHCTGNTCRSEEHDFRFTWKGAFLHRIEEIERPPCPTTPGNSTR